MKFINRLMVFFSSFMLFSFLLFFTGQWWLVFIPVLGLIYLALGGLIHGRSTRV